jgi:hypothetical protein
MPKLDQKPSEEPAWLSLVAGQISSLKYGVIQVVVHDSRVIRIERTEKLRLDREDSPATKVLVEVSDSSPGGAR